MKIVIADDHRLVLAGVRQMLELDGGFEVVGETSDGAEVLSLVAATEPEVVLLDLRMPGVDGLACLERLRSSRPEVHVVMCSGAANPELIQAAFKAGACGYIVKSINPRDLGSAIRQAVEGTTYHASGLPAISTHTLARAAGLSARELDVMRAVARGLANKAIAKELWISEQTVKFHLTSVYRKLGVTNRTEAARWALSRGLGGTQLVAIVTES